MEYTLKRSRRAKYMRLRVYPPVVYTGGWGGGRGTGVPRGGRQVVFDRWKTVGLPKCPDGSVILTVPFASHPSAIREFVAKQTEWLKRAVARMLEYKMLPVSGRRDYLKYKEKTRNYIQRRIQFWNERYGFTYNRLAIKNTRRTWGSCSRKGNLNFSYALLFLPRELSDYVVVHELCHLAHPNHSRSFWAEVEKTIPDFQTRRHELRRYLPR